MIFSASSSEFSERIRNLRRGMEEFGRIIDDLDGDGGFAPSHDSEFWRDLDRIEAVGMTKDMSAASWLANLTQVDDLGPNGRAFFLATAALDALHQIPLGALTEGKKLHANLRNDASRYRKVGVCLVLEASASPDAIPLMKTFLSDDSDYVKSEAAWSVERLQKRLQDTLQLTTL